MKQSFSYPMRIVLAGFMGTGKSRVAKILAKKLGYVYLDCDELIAKKAKKSIVQIFKQEGEGCFRKLESKVLKDLFQKKKVVIALGGGALSYGNNLREVLKRTSPILLTASVSTLLKRLSRDNTRPLLQGKTKREQIERLLKQRAPFYYQIPEVLATDRLSPAQISNKIIKRLQLPRDSLTVHLGSRSYPIYFFHGGLKNLPKLLTPYAKDKKIFILTNTKVGRLYLEKVQKILVPHFQVTSLKIPDGEQYKNLNTVKNIFSQMIKQGVDRKTLLLALGGGVVGDIGGFVAGTFLRGIPFVQIPTTLLAQVDSSVGGKTGVDLKEGKNLVGLFNQPKMVFIDGVFLETLPKREFRCGMAEVIKYGAIWDRTLFERLEALAPLLHKKQFYLLVSVIRRCCEIKAYIVENDELELSGLRSLLNFGHTLGHALEAVTGYRSMLHGEAIARGMVFAAERSYQKKLCDRQVPEQLKSLLERYGLTTDFPKVSRKTLISALKSDKKRVSSLIHFVYLREIGKAAVKETPLRDIL